MLQTQTVASTTLELLKQLSQLPFLSSFALVGGTNLSLRYGHRLSIDLDFFSWEKFDPMVITSEVKKRFPDATVTGMSEYMGFMMVQDVKIDLVYNPYPLLHPIEDFDKIRLMSAPDVIALKLNAIARRGVKKDFRDIATLVDHYTIKDMLGFFQKKFSIDEIGYVIRALFYFDDAEKDRIGPVCLTGQTRDQVKTKVSNAVRAFVDAELGG